MSDSRKYLVKKVADGGEDTAVDAGKFDALLKRLIQSPPIPNKEIGGFRKGKPTTPQKAKRS